jgi:hypothetical protein
MEEALGEAMHVALMASVPIASDGPDGVGVFSRENALIWRRSGTEIT